MATILNIQTDFAGQIGVEPRIVRIKTDGTLSDVVANDFLQGAIQMGFTFLPTDIVAVTYANNDSGMFQVSNSGNPLTLLPLIAVGEFTHVTTWSGPIPATSGNITYNKIGNFVVLMIPPILVAGNNTQNNISMDVVLPSDILPHALIQEPRIVQTNGGAARTTGMFELTTDGQINWGKDADFTAFDAVTTFIGFPATAIVYLAG